MAGVPGSSFAEKVFGSDKIIRVGVVGAGEVAQTTHVWTHSSPDAEQIDTDNLDLSSRLSDYFPTSSRSLHFATSRRSNSTTVRPSFTLGRTTYIQSRKLKCIESKE
jgi:hypothetical protein